MDRLELSDAQVRRTGLGVAALILLVAAGYGLLGGQPDTPEEAPDTQTPTNIDRPPSFCETVSFGMTASCQPSNRTGEEDLLRCEAVVRGDDTAMYRFFPDLPANRTPGRVQAGEQVQFTLTEQNPLPVTVVPVDPATGEQCENKRVSQSIS
ncbi:MAG: hypothetical protein SVW77_01465 [Candidatus Nanohaloarchaea archaeon]|nr:hypothetical protein [Candidatus Nanohaloarchaea archaeon]